MTAVHPTVFLVIGPAGSGKSTVSKRIAAHHRAVYLDKDTLASGFTELLLKERGFSGSERDDNAFYTDVVLPIEYDTLLRACGDNLALGNSVVLDAPFGRRFADPDYLVREKSRHGWPEARVVVVHVEADGDTVRERLAGRGYDRDAWKLGHWDEFWAGALAVECRWLEAEHVVLENTGPAPDITAIAETLARNSP